MAPLDLDKYVEIARHCKYLPENDLKVRRRVYLFRATVFFLFSKYGSVSLGCDSKLMLLTKFVELAWFLFNG